MEKWVTELQTTQMVRFIDELNTGSQIPQYLHIQYCESTWRMGLKADAPYNMWIANYVSKYYDKVTDFFFWNRIPAKEQVDYIFKRDLWKIKPEFEDRMIRAGYGQDPWNKSYGKYFDIERGFHGYPGPLTKKLNK